MNISLSVAALILGLRVLPPMPTRSAGTFDILLTLGAPTLVYGLAPAVSNGSFTGPTVLLIVAGISR